MSDQSLIKLTVPVAPVEFTESAKAARTDALCASANITEVVDPASQDSAVAAQKILRNFLRSVEKARKEAKEPVLAAGIALDDATKEFTKRPLAEEVRIARLVGDYQQAEAEKLREAQRKAAAEQDRIERERAEAVAKAEAEAKAAMAAAKDEEERKAAAARLEAEKVRQDEFSQQQKEAVPEVIAPAKAAGQSVREEWEITRINEFALMKARPDLVRKVEFDVRSIKEELNRGVKLPGVEAQLFTKSTVRLGRSVV